MANQIARFFESQPGDNAALQTADHLKSFWDPRMRRGLAAHVSAGGAGLTPVAASAAALLAVTKGDELSAALIERGEPTSMAPGDDAG
jgi:formate dehydrogenase subunit delta